VFFAALFLSDSGNNQESGGVSSPSPGPAPAGHEQSVDPDRARDQEAILRFLAGDGAGFEELMNRYRQRAYGIALSLTGNHDDAMDAVQKAFIRIHRSLGRFRTGEPFSPWFHRIVRNAALNQRRDQKRHQGEVPLEWVDRPDGRPDPLQEVEVADLKAKLWAGIQALPTDLREVFVMYHFQGLKYREIAHALGVPMGTVMSRLHAARLRLRDVKEIV
jgi:RNA polymerase sigma-70 factor (ECF subfamily)